MMFTARPAVILLYHRVADLAHDPHSLSVSADRFAAHLEVLARDFEVVPLAEVRRPGRGRRLAITFDDGYVDNAEVAAPLLSSAGLRATLFATTGALDDGTEFWWDRLEHLVSKPGKTEFLELEIADRCVRIDIRTPAGRARAIRALNRRLRVLPPLQIEETVRTIAAQVDLRAAPCKTHARLGAEALRRLAANRTFEVGGHTHNHPRLAALAPVEQQNEIEVNRHILEQVVRRPVHSFAYPFGSPGTFDATTVNIVRATGYELACANVPGRVHRWTNRYRLPRHLVGNWLPDEFARRLDAWFDARNGT